MAARLTGREVYRLIRRVVDEDEDGTGWAETTNGPFKTELIEARGAWGTVDAVEYAAAEYVD